MKLIDELKDISDRPESELVALISFGCIKVNGIENSNSQTIITEKDVITCPHGPILKLLDGRFLLYMDNNTLVENFEKTPFQFDKDRYKIEILFRLNSSI